MTTINEQQQNNAEVLVDKLLAEGSPKLVEIFIPTENAQAEVAFAKALIFRGFEVENIAVSAKTSGAGDAAGSGNVEGDGCGRGHGRESGSASPARGCPGKGDGEGNGD
jgi:hypothetical protein